MTVVIPAYNAEDTIDETLLSARSQTHADIEILVVDDGSRDATASIVERHAQADPRVRLLKQANGGVARARNLGISEARGELIAPLDADDLWAPTKIARQLEALHRGGARVALVYTRFAAIDEDGLIAYQQDAEVFEGNVLPHLYSNNFLGNASSALMRKSAILDVGGYETRLRDAGAQGCEDFLLYFRIADRYEFAVVPDYLTGYRERLHSMSYDTFQMFKSFQIVEREMVARHSHLAPSIRKQRARTAAWLLHKSLVAADSTAVRYLLLQIAIAAPQFIPALLIRLTMWKAKRLLSPLTGRAPVASRERFSIGQLIEPQAISKSLPAKISSIEGA